MSKKLFDRASWTSPIDCYKSIIWEYDMSQAGLSVIRDKKLISKEKGEYLANLPKHERVVQIGKLCQKDEELTEGLEEGLKDAVYEFCDTNDILESDIISIKKDAVYVTHPASKLLFGDYIKWREASRYSCFYNFSGIEVYYNQGKKILDVKGLTEEAKNKHKVYFFPFLMEMLNCALSDNKLSQIVFFKSLRHKYLNWDMEEEIYREFNRQSLYRLTMDLSGLGLYSDSFIPNITDMTWNYQQVIVPIIKSCL